jgi:hypothetical protein
MENTVKNIRSLKLNDTDAERLEAGANLYKRHANITFKIIKFFDGVLTVQVKQEKNLRKKYLSKNELIGKANNLFNSFGKEFKPSGIIVHSIPFQESDSEIVTPEYLKKELQRKHLRIKDIQTDTGIETSNISAWVNGVRPMSNIVKNMFYYYLQNK